MGSHLTMLLLFAFSLCAVAQEEIVQLGNFEAGEENWVFYESGGTRFAKRNFTIVPLPPNDPGGKYAARLSGDFTTGGGCLVFQKSFPPPLRIKEARFRIRTSGNMKGIFFRLIDSTWQTHQQLLPLRETTEWQQLSASHIPGSAHWGGENDGKWHPPAVGMALAIDRSLLKGMEKAEIFVDKIEAVLCAPEGVIIKQMKLGNVFLENEPVRFGLWSDTNAVSWTVSDFWEKTVAEEKELRVAQGDCEITIPVKSKGYLTLSVVAKGDATRSARTSFAVLSVPDMPTAQDSPFAMQTHFGQNWRPEIMPLISAAGIKTIRDELYWENIELEKEKFTFPDSYDRYMSDLKANHIQPLIILTYRNKFYDDNNTPYTEDGLKGYTRYGQEILRRYGKQIEWVEVYNEYNISFCRGPAASKPTNYVEMLKKTHVAVKDIRPDVTVVGCATAGVPFKWLEDVFRLGGLNCMDVVSIHPYHQPHPPEGNDKTWGMDRKVNAVADLIRKHNGGASKPIWVTEVGWPTDAKFSEETQAEYLVRCYVLLLSAGAEKIFWFKFMDGVAPADYFGLIRNPVSPLGLYVPKPSYVAYAVMTRQLRGAEFIKREDIGNDVRGYLFKNDREEIRVMWSPVSGSVAMETTASLKVVDMMGNEREAQPIKAEVHLPVSSSPVYVRGAVQGVKGAS
ncbi:MAG: hypothetical protein AB1696_09235 [Planctomycetota bacterium]